MGSKTAKRKAKRMKRPYNHNRPLPYIGLMTDLGLSVCFIIGLIIHIYIMLLLACDEDGCEVHWYMFVTQDSLSDIFIILFLNYQINNMRSPFDI